MIITGSGKRWSVWRIITPGEREEEPAVPDVTEQEETVPEEEPVLPEEEIVLTPKAQAGPVYTANPMAGKGEVRGIWISYVDFPSLGLKDVNAATFRKNIGKVLDEAKKYKTNTVFFHVRIFDDAVWKSDHFKACGNIVSGAGYTVSSKVYSYDPLEIVIEEASHKTPEGDPIFWKLLQGRSGKAVWLYEADLTLRWINTANPDEDFRQITLHAIGTNDGGPDKAKGSAWTYCLKYYLFEKFNIDQGEADPDKGQNSAEDALRPHRGSQSEDPGGSGQRPPSETQAQQEPRKRLTGPQMDRLYRKAEACSLSREAVDQRIRKKFGREDPADLSREEYDAICASLDEAARRAQDQNTGGDENAE